MLRSRPRLLATLLLCTGLVLVGCDSAEERAARHYAQALALLEDGDTTRALLELRNVFDHDGTHQEARKLYADLMMEQGDVAQAARHYLLLAEQYPDMAEVRQILAEIAIDRNDWDEARRHGEVALDLAPEEGRTSAIGLALAYQQAARDRNDAARAELSERAAALIERQPENLIPRRIVIDQLLAEDATDAALVEIDAALEIEPEDFALNLVRLQLLFAREDVSGVTEQLETMVRYFPENEDLRQDLLSWYLSSEQTEAAETYLRGEAGEVTDDPEGHLMVVDLLRATQGDAAARAELERLAAATEGTENADAYLAALALMDFQDGAQERAIATLEAIVDQAERSDQTRDLMMRLAGMHLATEQEARARELVATVLEQDRTHVDALLQRAAWAIAEGQITQAINDLRTAQSQAPRDARIMSALANAFLRDGSPDLAGEQLAMAVQAAGAAPAETLRYIAFLRSQGRSSAIEPLLNDARRVAPQDTGVLTELARIYLEDGRWAEASEIAAVLESIEGETAARLAQGVQAAILLGQNRIDEGLSLLERQAAEMGDDMRGHAAVLSMQLRTGRAEAARDYLAPLLEADPDNPELLLLSANLEAVTGDQAAAEAQYRRILEIRPDADNVARLLYGLLRGRDRAGEASALLETALAAAPDSAILNWFRAEELERSGDFEDAIAAYEAMHARDPDSIVLRNNLASMLSTYREDEESLERARDLARPLRASEVPAFLDTYGWIAYRLGDLQTARDYLERAAEGLPDEPLVQYHLAMVYADLDRTEEAIDLFERAIDLAGDRPLPQIARARARLAELHEAAAAP